ncbi:MAG: CHAD domain-containing protein [Pseudomonadota bacterium]
MKEIELKLLVDEGMAERLHRSPVVTQFAEGEPRTARLRTIYLDTPTQTLADAGIALRVRSEGDGWWQSIKARKRMEAGLSEATESEAPLPGPVPDLDRVENPELREALTQALGTAPAEPLFETEVTRTIRRLSLPSGTVELAVDIGRISAGEREGRLVEAELELVSGSPRAVFEAARRLFPDGGARLSTLSKADRGALLLSAGTIEADPSPRLAKVAAIEPGWTAERAAHAVLSECQAQIAANLAVVLNSDDPEGPHQLRVGLRRLRSAFLVFAPALGGPEQDRLDTEARWLSHEVGRLRDLDVARTDILEPEIDEGMGAFGFEALAERVRAQADTSRAELRECLAGGRVFAFLLDLGAFIAARGWLDPADWDQTARLAMPAEQALGAALDERLTRSERKGQRIAGLSIESRHDLRRELKKLRYAVEFAAPLWPEKTVRPFLKRLKELQEIFGDLNDLAMAEMLFLAPDGPVGNDAPAARAAGFVIGVRTERARRSWEDAKGLWKAFTGTKPFWR